VKPTEAEPSEAEPTEDTELLAPRRGAYRSLYPLTSRYLICRSGRANPGPPGDTTTVELRSITLRRLQRVRPRRRGIAPESYTGG
jgi:hypothetical protein